MVDFYYSEDASNITHLFYGADVMVYVEGEDDVPFWEVIFGCLASYKVEVQDMGGSNELAKQIEMLQAGKLNGIIACDSDFETIKGCESNKNIIRTYGYAIENTVISYATVLKVIKSVGKISSRNAPNSEIEAWQINFFNIMKGLIIHDIYNELNIIGTSVVGDNCSRFFKAKNSHDICEKKVSQYIKSLNFTVSDAETQQINILISLIQRELNDFIRGHFLFSAVSKFISSSIKQINTKASISNDALYGALLLAFEHNFNSEHKHYNHYKAAIDQIVLAA